MSEMGEVSRDVAFISYVVKRLDLAIIKEAEVNELITRIVNILLPANIHVDIGFLREIVLPQYTREEYPGELTPVHRIRELSSDMMLAVPIAIEAEEFSKLKATGLGKLYIEEGKIESKGFWILEVQEADPTDNVVERSKKLQKYVVDAVITLVISLLVELLARVFS